MRILLVIDGSSYCDMATRLLGALQLPPQTELAVLNVVPERAFLGGITLAMLKGADDAKKEAQRQKATELLRGSVETLSASGLKVESMVRWGNPAEEILRVADQTRVSLVVMGAKGLTDSPTFRLGSVALKVMKYASCSVLLARKKTGKINRGVLSDETTAAADRVLLATDGSKYSDSANQLLLELPLPQQSQVIVVTALQSHVAAWVKTPTLDFEADRQVLADLQKAEEKEARRIIGKSEEQFQRKGYKTRSVVMRGGAAESILKAAEEYAPDIIAIGSKGASGIVTLLLGSVSERVARHAPCSVLIARLPRA